MSAGRIVIVSGPPGAGKSAVARRLAETAAGPLAIHLHTDDFYAYIRKGYVPPWQPESHAQNAVVLDALAATAAIVLKGPRTQSPPTLGRRASKSATPSGGSACAPSNRRRSDVD